MENLSIGQVVLATFPFSNLTSNKLRPCLIIGVAEFNDIVLCQITSKSYNSKRAASLNKNDFTEGSIVINSFIRPDKIALGTVSKTKLDEVKHKLKLFLDIK